jgi:hypothetical protein
MYCAGVGLAPTLARFLGRDAAFSSDPLQSLGRFGATTPGKVFWAGRQFEVQYRPTCGGATTKVGPYFVKGRHYSLESQRPDSLREALSHVYWIGGSPCAGKSTIVELLSEPHPFYGYNCDQAFERHGERVTPEKQPTFHKVLHMTWDEIWMRPVDLLLADEITIYGEEFAMILQDLLALPRSPPILAEGAALLPHLVDDVLANPWQAIWVVPDEAFQRKQYPRRGAWVQEILSQCREPEQAFQNWMDRDVAFGHRVSAEAAARGLQILRVDGQHTIAENAEIVRAHFRLS